MGGSIQYPKDFLKRAYEITRENGGVCLADEVMLGGASHVMQSTGVYKSCDAEF